MEDLVLTKKQMAVNLDTSVRTIERWVAENRIPHFYLPIRGSRKEVRFVWSKVVRFLENKSKTTKIRVSPVSPARERRLDE